MKIRGLSVDKYMEKVKAFHGHLAPGMVCGGFMVELIMRNLPENGLYDAIVETRACLPDTVQVLTPCTIGNGWLKIMDTGRFSMMFYDKYSGYGVRASLDQDKLVKWPEFKAWANKEKKKSDQDTRLIFEEIVEAGLDAYRTEKVFIDTDKLYSEKGKIKICKSCRESFRTKKELDICPFCNGEFPVYKSDDEPAFLEKVNVDESIGKKVLHDMTRIDGTSFKGTAVFKDQKISASDAEMMKSMGKESVYTQKESVSEDFMHEDEAAEILAAKLSGKNTFYLKPPREGKINIKSEINGLLFYDEEKLKAFNSCEDVICAACNNYLPVKKDQIIAGTRAIPLYVRKNGVLRAAEVLNEGLFFNVYPYINNKIGIVVTGTEVSSGRIKDAFIPVIRKKIINLGLINIYEDIVPDDSEQISESVTKAVEKGCEIIVVTGGLSVDPDDLTRKGLKKAGLKNEVYGAPVLPGAMTLTGETGNTKIIGVPAGGIYFEKTAFDIIFPRLAAGFSMNLSDTASLGAGGLLT